MTRSYLFIILSIVSLAAAAQEVRLTPAQVEAMFLEQNLELISERMNVSIADAAIAQAKVWDNPEFSVNDINLWEKGNPKQFSVELNQLFSLSARRTKAANVEKAGKEIAIKQFEELLRGLKFELRSSITEVIYTQSSLEVIEKQKVFLEDVVADYQTQYDRGNVTKSELLRLQTALFAIESDINDTRVELNTLQKTLKNLLSIDPAVVIAIVDERLVLPSPPTLNPVSLIETALTHRPDLQAAKLTSQYHSKDIIYQKSLAIPDVSLGLKYDRSGGVWDNFVGIGVGMEIPLFNRNKGAIKTAKIQLKQSELLVEHGQKTLQNEVMESFMNYSGTYSFIEKSLNNPALSQLDEQLAVYAKNLLAKHIPMVEYMDFMDSYRSTKEMILSKQKELRLQFEQLQFSIGMDVK